MSGITVAGDGGRGRKSRKGKSTKGGKGSDARPGILVSKSVKGNWLRVLV